MTLCCTLLRSLQEHVALAAALKADALLRQQEAATTPVPAINERSRR